MLQFCSLRIKIEDVHETTQPLVQKHNNEGRIHATEPPLLCLISILSFLVIENKHSLKTDVCLHQMMQKNKDNCCNRDYS